MPAIRRNHDTSPPSANSSPSSSWIHLRSILLVVASSSPAYCSSSLSPRRVHHKSPWFRKRKKHPLSLQQWRSFFTEDGKLCDGGMGFLKKVRCSGVHPSIRSEVWPFLLGVYDLDSTLVEREICRVQKRRDYEKLRRYCVKLGRKCPDGAGAPDPDSADGCFTADSPSSNKDIGVGEYFSAHESQRVDFFEEMEYSYSESPMSRESLARHESEHVDSTDDIEYSDSESRVCHLSGESAVPAHGSRPVDLQIPRASLPHRKSQLIDFTKADKSQCIDYTATDETRRIDSTSADKSQRDDSTACDRSQRIVSTTKYKGQRVDFIDEGETEGFGTWWRIIRANAVRAEAEEGEEEPVSEEHARRSAAAVGLREYGQLSPWQVLHSARLVAVLEAYAACDPEIGYCQGMADLLSPVASTMKEDHCAFWCFVGFMGGARENFRVDGSGIRRQLALVSGIIKRRDGQLYRHLERAKAEECLFVYRMVVVMLRRELDPDQTLCLWEAVWADRAAVRAGFSGRGRRRGDLLLYVAAAAVLQRRRDIMDKCESAEDILRECNGLSGRLDVWKLLDDAHEIGTAEVEL